MYPNCTDPQHMPCPNGCGGEVHATRTCTQIDRYDVDLETGESVPHYVTLPLHIPDVGHWTQDPTGLVAVTCTHGLAEHPNGQPLPTRGFMGVPRSWLRSKYARSGHRGEACVVCHGEPRPADLTTPREV